jgi:Glycine zipper 2TM domain
MSDVMHTHAATLAVGLSVLLGACVAPPRASQPAQSAPVPPSTEVYFYPTAGQSAAQQDRDRYECYLWSVKQTSYDPGQPQLAPHQRIVVEPRPPAGVDTAAGAVTGAAIGAAVSRPGNAGGGAIVGAVAGAVLGAASDSARQAHAQDVQRRYDRADSQRYAESERRAQDYRRAMQACLEGRGYAVN